MNTLRFYGEGKHNLLNNYFKMGKPITILDNKFFISCIELNFTEFGDYIIDVKLSQHEA